MPRIRRWFPVSHDINGDPEVWELTDRFGDRAFRVWMEVLSIADRHEGILKGSPSEWAQMLVRVFSKGNPRWLKRDSETVHKALLWMSDKGWIVIREGSKPSLVVSKFAEYHRHREQKEIPLRKGKGSPPSEPSYPSDPSVLPKQTLKDISADPAQPAGSAPPTKGNGFDPDTRNWLLATKHLRPLAEDKHADFWSLLVEAYDRYPWLYFEEQIRLADVWIESNPSRAPTPRGLRRFMRTWLNNAVEYGRKQHG